MAKIKTCPLCKKDFIATKRTRKTKFCSVECFKKHLEIEREKKRSEKIGQKFGKWTILKFAFQKFGHDYFLCQCDCGTLKKVVYSSLKNGESKSCGCILKEKCSLPHYKKLKAIFNAMRNRCLNPNVKEYKNYGKRGITICQEWLDDFMNFYDWAINNGYEEGLTIERIDVNGNYCPENCCWISLKEQSKNRRCNIMVTINDETHCLSDWCRIFKKDAKTVHYRIHTLHWNISKALEVPIKSPHKADK